MDYLQYTTGNITDLMADAVVLNLIINGLPSIHKISFWIENYFIF